MAPFGHPYEPYDIQVQFMEALYKCIDEGKIGLFESPTGTGKSLSLLCGSLSWLRDFKRTKMTVDLAGAGDDNDDPEWMREAAANERRRTLVRQRQELEEHLAKIREKEAKQKAQYGESPRRKKPKVVHETETNGESVFELEEYDSDDGTILAAGRHNESSGLSAASQALLAKLAPSVAVIEADFEDELKIIYASRTHSQLSQFVAELRRVKVQSIIVTDDDQDGVDEKLKHLSLGSRKNLCINPRVVALGSATAITERCLELQQPSTSSDHKCPFVPSKENVALVNDFRDHAMASIRDIEDLGALGKKVEVCPYYASRSVINPSEIVTLPYPLLLQKSARDSLGLSLKNHVVIIDEAHNLMDAICNVFSLSISLSELQRSSANLMVYARKFKARLKGKNRAYVTQTIRLIDSVAAALHLLQSAGRTHTESVVQPASLMAGKGVDQINPHKLTVYLKESKLAWKVDRYVSYTTQGSSNETVPANPVLLRVQSFLAVLMNPAAEGRLFASTMDNDVHLRYTLIDPTNHFRDIVEDARAVILAGGTMSPMNDYTAHLFSYVSPERLSFHRFGHVIPPTNLCVATLDRGPLGTDFDFTFERRSSEKLILELGATILQLALIILDGLVIFFPSYDYLSQVLKVWQNPSNSRSASTSDDSFWHRLSNTKPIFYENKDTNPSSTNNGATGTETVLQSYTNSISAHKGGLLLSVVGGSLSEGINFSDALGRGVVVVGLPFPNIHSAEWKAKIEYIESSTLERLKANVSGGGDGDLKAQAKAAGREFYENCCMRAVNQCIGRAIRHKNDYASIVLIDRRYGTKRIQEKLPVWMKGSMLPGGQGFASTERSIKEFFLSKNATARV